MFLVISLNRAYYLYGASSSSNRNAMATYALQWEAIQIAKSKGCVDYDMFGVAPRPDPHHPLYGLYKFKLGFGGKLYHSIGSWDYPLNGEQYNRFVSMELNGKGYHLS
jgi:lipid II:glycine glycyltransferase (peptidoglycan interpeptide bridge formation enzyme)